MSEPEPEHAVPQRPGHHIKAFPFLSPHFLCYPAARRDSDRGCYCSPIPILMTSLLNGQVNLEVNGTAVTESVIVPPLDSAAPPPCFFCESISIAHDIGALELSPCCCCCISSTPICWAIVATTWGKRHVKGLRHQVVGCTPPRSASSVQFQSLLNPLCSLPHANPI